MGLEDLALYLAQDEVEEPADGRLLSTATLARLDGVLKNRLLKQVCQGKIRRARDQDRRGVKRYSCHQEAVRN